MKIIVVGETDCNILLTTPTSVTQYSVLLKTLQFCTVYETLS